MPRIARPAMRLDGVPAPAPAPDASAAAIGEVLRAEETPLQRSPAALRRVVAVARAGVRAAALAAAAGFAAAVAVERATEVEAAGATVRGETAVGRDCAALDERDGRVTLRWATAPLAVAELRAPETALAAAGADAFAVAFAGACVGVGAGWGSTGGTFATGGVTGVGAGVTGLGGAIGDDGVPNPGGVQAHASPAPATATLSSDKTNTPDMRTLVYTRASTPSTTAICAVHLHHCAARRNASVVACRRC